MAVSRSASSGTLWTMLGSSPLNASNGAGKVANWRKRATSRAMVDAVVISSACRQRCGVAASSWRSQAGIRGAGAAIDRSTRAAHRYHRGLAHAERMLRVALLEQDAHREA